MYDVCSELEFIGSSRTFPLFSRLLDTDIRSHSRNDTSVLSHFTMANSAISQRLFLTQTASSTLKDARIADSVCSVTRLARAPPPLPPPPPLLDRCLPSVQTPESHLYCNLNKGGTVSDFSPPLPCVWCAQQEDSLDMTLEAAYNHASVWNVSKAGTVTRASTMVNPSKYATYLVLWLRAHSDTSKSQRHQNHFQGMRLRRVQGQVINSIS